MDQSVIDFDANQQALRLEITARDFRDEESRVKSHALILKILDYLEEHNLAYTENYSSDSDNEDHQFEFDTVLKIAYKRQPQPSNILLKIMSQFETTHFKSISVQFQLDDKTRVVYVLNGTASTSDDSKDITVSIFKEVRGNELEKRSCAKYKESSKLISHLAKDLHKFLQTPLDEVMKNISVVTSDKVFVYDKKYFIAKFGKDITLLNREDAKSLFLNIVNGYVHWCEERE